MRLMKTFTFGKYFWWLFWQTFFWKFGENFLVDILRRFILEKYSREGNGRGGRCWERPPSNWSLPFNYEGDLCLWVCLYVFLCVCVCLCSSQLWRWSFSLYSLFNYAGQRKYVVHNFWNVWKICVAGCVSPTWAQHSRPWRDVGVSWIVNEGNWGENMVEDSLK